jgi:photosystem II stability/assembly factor-like uncharacterized protein
MKGFKFHLAALFTSILFLSACSQKQEAAIEDGGEENSEGRIAWETKMLADPAIGKIPENIRAKELAFAATIPVLHSNKSQRGEPFWKQRGPWNVGGRTRAIAIDVANENTIFAAGVSGGIWRTTNGGAYWQKMTKPNQLLNITCLAQDTRPGKTNIWYAGTGEYLGNSASGSVAFYYGDGILKSTDNGQTWNLLASTSVGKPQALSKDFNLVHNIAIHKADTSNIVYAATYGGVYRSVDGGTKWTKVRGAGLTNGSALSDVAVTSAGVVYATMSSEGNQRGIWRSVDGINWTNITPSNFAPIYNRMVIGIDPNDENRVYIFASTPGSGKKGLDFRKREDWSSLWKYTYVSGNGTGAGGFWEDRSANLPGLGGHFGDINTQGGYDMYVRIKPGDPNTVFLGSTNIWRSTDAFATSDKISWIGGYGPGSALPDYTYVPNHHPDQHNLVFYPSNPDMMLTSHDGGISKTTDNKSEIPVWTSLCNGYLTTQFYTVAIDHGTPGSNEIMGGLQDNGTYLTRTTNGQSPWAMPGNGDGSFCAITDGATDYYVSKQNGQSWRLKLDNNGNPVQWARIDPPLAKVTNFINPFTLDPNDQKRMYFIGGTRLWVNNDLTQIPLKAPKDTNKTAQGWSKLSTQVDTVQQIGAVAVSRKPADVLYYGTELGKLYRVDGASTGTKNAVNITSALFPVNAYISNICIDPKDAQKVIVVFSNYSVQSLFYTTNGGTSWTAVSGNLEQNSNGTGNGPSCRWAAILPIKDKRAYFIATSTGLYSTDTLMGANTIWTQQDPEGIGNNVCTMLDTRPADGLLVIATHGAGMYSANILFTYQITGTEEKKSAISSADVRIYPNPMKDAAQVELQIKKAESIRIEILDELGRIVAIPFDGYLQPGRQSIPIRNVGWKSGIYYCRVSDKESVVSKGFVVR